MPCQYGTSTAFTGRMVLVDESLCKLEGVESLLEATNRGIRQTMYSAGEQCLPFEHSTSTVDHYTSTPDE